MTTRRRFIAAALATAGAAPVLSLLYAWRVESGWLDFVHRPLPIAGLPASLSGRTLVQLSDLHVGPRVSDGYLRDTFRRVQALGPDFVAVTGDWITYRGPAQLEQFARILEVFPRGRLGTVGILGNHDYGFGWRMDTVADRVAAAAEAAGITMLRNEARRIAGLQFVGLDDLWGPRFDPSPVLSAHGAEPATLALSHNPDSADRPGWAGYSGWILSGHTHGGQCRPPFLPPPLLPVENRRYTCGAFALAGRRTLYISRGVGHLIPVRFNVRPEVTVFHLLPATGAPATS
jgi:uncharacterized protein